MRSLIARWDQWKPTSMLKINLGISAFILVGHIGGAFAFIAEAAEPKPTFWSFLGVDDAVAIVVLVSAVAALAKSEFQWQALRIHAIVLSCLAVGWLVWAFTLAVGKLPHGNFVWNPILFAFLCAYPVYLIRRTYLADALVTSAWARYAHVLVAAASMIPSGIIIYKAMSANV